MEPFPGWRKEWEEEERRLAYVIARIREAVLCLEEEAGQRREDVDALLASLWEDVSLGVDESTDVLESFADILQQSAVVAELEKRISLSGEEAKSLLRLLSSPYFGRVDFREEGSAEAERYYIGRRSFYDAETDSYLVLDWRAPVAGLFYEGVLGHAAYETPAGEIRGELTKKRQFDIRGGRLRAMFDVSGAAVTDDILREVLGRGARPEMGAVVETIQAEQNSVIRDDRHDLVVVQGVAGSGKTSVALQRLAYLLYRHRERARANQMLVLSPNPLFREYISSVLPELGEENVLQRTFFEYVVRRIGADVEVEPPEALYEFLLETDPSDPRHGVRREALRWKGSPVFVHVLDRFAHIVARIAPPFRPIRVRDFLLFSREELAALYLGRDGEPTRAASDPSPRARLYALTEGARRKLERKLEKLRTSPELEDALHHLSRTQLQRAYLKARRREDPTTLETRMQEILKDDLLDEIRREVESILERRGFLDWAALYRLLYAADDVWRAATAGLEDAFPPSAQAAVREATLRALDRGRMTFEDAVPYVYLRELVGDFPRESGVHFVVVDEAQDYTPLDFAWLSRLFPRANFTLLGDLAQEISGLPSLLDDGGFAFLAAQRTGFRALCLRRSYRSTREIALLAQDVLAEPLSLVPFARSGEVPILHLFERREELAEGIAVAVQRALRRGYGLVAVLCRSQWECDEAEAFLKGRFPYQRVRHDTPSLRERVVLMPSYLAKGIEFDVVFLYDVSRERYREDRDRRLLYILLMRAKHDVELFALGTPSPLLAAGLARGHVRVVSRGE